MIIKVTAQDTKELRSFALVMMWAIPLLFILIIPWLFSTTAKYEVLWLSVVLAILYVLFPKGIYPFYRIWMFIAGILGWINTRLLLGIVFYLLILPIGFVMRSFGKLNYRARMREDESSYWIKNDESLDNDYLERPF